MAVGVVAEKVHLNAGSLRVLLERVSGEESWWWCTGLSHRAGSRRHVPLSRQDCFVDTCYVAPHKSEG